MLVDEIVEDATKRPHVRLFVDLPRKSRMMLLVDTGFQEEGGGGVPCTRPADWLWTACAI